MSASMRACKAAITTCVCGLLSANVHAAGGPYVVDDATIGDVGECKVESWVSVASNGDFIGVTQPACVVRIGVPVEFQTTFQPARTNGEWATFAGVRGKFILLREGANNPAVAMAIGTLFDATNGENLTFVNVPLTIKVRDDFRLNVNAGWLRDTIDETNHLTWGGSVEWDFRKSWTLITEVFGLTGHKSEPRMQGGLRYSPTKSIDLDVIYGHNLIGEKENWITAGVTARF
jgi:hypothetical protein